jgi:hypothetical protein
MFLAIEVGMFGRAVHALPATRRGLGANFPPSSEERDRAPAMEEIIPSLRMFLSH